MKTYEITLERDYYKHTVEIDVIIEYNVTPGCKGARDSLCGKRNAGPPLEPDEPPELEILRTYDKRTGHDVELTQEEEERAIIEIWEDVADNQMAAEEARWDAWNDR